MPKIFEPRVTTLSLAACVAVASVGCAHVNRDELTAGLDEVRAEQRAGDDAIAGRVDAMEVSVDDRLRDLELQQANTEERLNDLEMALRDLEAELGVTIERLEDSIAFSVPLYFGFDSATLEGDQTGVLDRFAGVYGQYYSGSLLTVEGFTDEAGPDEYNEILGKRRAEEVKSYLTEIGGLNAERVRTVSYGESPERLVTPGAYGHQRGRENRRVVLVIDTSAMPSETADVGR